MEGVYVQIKSFTYPKIHSLDKANWKLKALLITVAGHLNELISTLL